jgi:hypothetical protein
LTAAAYRPIVGRCLSAEEKNMESFRTTADRIIKTALKIRGIGPNELLAKIGMPPSQANYRKYRRWFEGPDRFPAERVGPICKALENYELLDIVEEQAGRVGAFVPHFVEDAKMEDVLVIHRFVRAVGGALNKLGETLENSVIDDNHLEPTLKEMNNVIAECVRLRQLLRKRHGEWVRAAYPKISTRKVDRTKTIEP